MPNTAAPVDTPWLTPATVADILSVNLRTVYAMVKDGRLPSHRLSSHIIRIHRDDIDAALGRPVDGAA